MNSRVKNVGQHMVGIHDEPYRITSLLLHSYLVLPNQTVLFFPLPQHHACESSWVSRETAEC